MKLKVVLLALVTVSVLAVLPSCRKNKIVKNETGQVSEDNNNIQQGIDAAVVDGSNSATNNSNINGRVQALAPDVCGATTDTTLRSQGIITLTFDGTSNCNGRIRSGKLRLTLQDYTSGKRWKDAGAVLRFDFIDYKVTRTADNIGLLFNGSTNLTNSSGGNVVLMVLGLQPSVIHKVDGNGLSVKFDDGKTSTFNVSRQYTHTYSNSVYQIKGEGTGNRNNLPNIENWGTTRDGDEFTSQVTDPVIWNSTCTAGKPVKGKLDIKVASKQFGLITTLGTDNSGNVVTNGCPWGLKVEWTYKNKTGSKLYAYH